MKYSLLMIALIVGACSQNQSTKDLDAQAFKELISPTVKWRKGLLKMQYK